MSVERGGNSAAPEYGRETGEPRENTPSSGIIWHAFPTCESPGVDLLGIKFGVRLGLGQALYALGRDARIAAIAGLSGATAAIVKAVHDKVSTGGTGGGPAQLRIPPPPGGLVPPTPYRLQSNSSASIEKKDSPPDQHFSSSNSLRKSPAEKVELMPIFLRAERADFAAISRINLDRILGRITVDVPEVAVGQWVLSWSCLSNHYCVVSLLQLHLKRHRRGPDLQASCGAVVARLVWSQGPRGVAMRVFEFKMSQDSISRSSPSCGGLVVRLLASYLDESDSIPDFSHVDDRKGKWPVFPPFIGEDSRPAATRPEVIPSFVCTSGNLARALPPLAASLWGLRLSAPRPVVITHNNRIHPKVTGVEMGTHDLPAGPCIIRVSKDSACSRGPISSHLNIPRTRTPPLPARTRVPRLIRPMHGGSNGGVFVPPSIVEPCYEHVYSSEAATSVPHSEEIALDGIAACCSHAVVWRVICFTVSCLSAITNRDSRWRSLSSIDCSPRQLPLATVVLSDTMNSRDALDTATCGNVSALTTSEFEYRRKSDPDDLPALSSGFFPIMCSTVTRTPFSAISPYTFLCLWRLKCFLCCGWEVGGEGLLVGCKGSSMPPLPKKKIVVGSKNILTIFILKPSMFFKLISTDDSPRYVIVRQITGGRGDVAARLLASHLDEPSSIPGGRFLHVGSVPDDATGQRVFSGISRLRRLFIPVLLHTHRISRPRCEEPPYYSASSATIPTSENPEATRRKSNPVHLRGRLILISPVYPSTIRFIYGEMFTFMNPCRKIGVTVPAHQGHRSYWKGAAVGVVGRALASPQSEPESVPGGVNQGPSHVGVMLDDVAGKAGIVEDLQFSSPLHSLCAPISHRFTFIRFQVLGVKSFPNLATTLLRRAFQVVKIFGRFAVDSAIIFLYENVKEISDRERLERADRVYFQRFDSKGVNNPRTDCGAGGDARAVETTTREWASSAARRRAAVIGSCARAGESVVSHGGM
ncbi:hypothetical protein PR048_007615 [Dryococelus australis]|uniref:Uncharacterized protein n=1 Tax=Dryococelus australis TaxID=614101 RepID=A0ABQ9HWE1_9NEOP|nr:hypothetical protein PR048_007615 [Dryococelus australis]